MERFSASIKVVLAISLLASTGIAYVSYNLIESTRDTEQSQCISYDSAQKLIEVRCESIHLTDIYNSLSNSSILRAEDNEKDSVDENNTARVWILNAGIVINKDSSLVIDSTDTSWLKIIPTPTIQKQRLANITESSYSNGTVSLIQMDSNNMSNIGKIPKGVVVVSKNNGDNPNGIHVHGSLKIDSVKITSWDPDKDDVIEFDFGKRPGEEHTKSDYDTAEQRAFIRISKDATATTNITNSEIAYLGYSCSRCAGLSYYGGEGSIIKDNDIHHLLKGYYSKGMGYMLIENNKVHDNYLYGIDPHTGSHDIVIRNNEVYDNNASGIICSKDCYNMLIENNEVYRNGGKGRGIAFSINTTDSIARNNDVHNNERCISFNRQSDNNRVYDNTISNCDVGIYLSNTSNNFIYNNNIVHSKFGIVIKNDTTNNITGNWIEETGTGITFINQNITGKLIDGTGTGITLVNQNANGTEIDPDIYYRKAVGPYLDRLKSDNKILDVSDSIASEEGNVKRLKDLLKP